VARGLLDPAARVTPGLKIQNGLTHLHNLHRIERTKPAGETKIQYRALSGGATPSTRASSPATVNRRTEEPRAATPPVANDGDEAEEGPASPSPKDKSGAAVEAARDAQGEPSVDKGPARRGHYLTGGDATWTVMLLERRPMTVGACPTIFFL
jgi:hypothetical protein